MRRCAAAQIGFDDGRMGLHISRLALGNLLTKIEHRYDVGDSHHQLHVVLDE